MKLRAVLRWSGVVACVLIAAVWVASGWFGVAAEHGGNSTYWLASVLGGRVHVMSWSRTSTTVFFLRFSTEVRARGQRPGWVWFPEWGSLNAGWFVAVPLHVPFAMAAGPTAWSFYRNAQRRKAKRPCVKCGYELAGLPPGAVCPECGKAVPS